jgi:G:T-mismatch repair DNA endonuclease (very short patch repair protein)
MNYKQKGEENILVDCACGCGNKRWKYDKKNREKRFIKGHGIVGKKSNTFKVGDKVSQCVCGCGKWITYKKYFGNCSIPIFIHGHNAMDKFKQGGENYTKGKTWEEIYDKDKLYYMRKLKRDFMINNNPMRNEESCIKHRIKAKENRKRQIFPVKDTKIELKIQGFLTELHLEYIAHKYMSEITHAYQCDIFLPVQNGITQKTILEMDGCYWHGCEICNKEINQWQEEQIIKDELRTKELIKQGFKVVRLKEHNIKIMKLNDFKEQLEISQ